MEAYMNSIVNKQTGHGGREFQTAMAAAKGYVISSQSILRAGNVTGMFVTIVMKKVYGHHRSAHTYGHHHLSMHILMKNPIRRRRKSKIRKSRRRKRINIVVQVSSSFMWTRVSS